MDTPEVHGKFARIADQVICGTISFALAVVGIMALGVVLYGIFK